MLDQIAHAEADVPALVLLDALHALAHPGQHAVLQVLEQRALPGGEHVPLEDHVVQGDALIQSDLARRQLGGHRRQPLLEQLEHGGRDEVPGRGAPLRRGGSGQPEHLGGDPVKELRVALLVAALEEEDPGHQGVRGRLGERREVLGDGRPRRRRSRPGASSGGGGARPGAQARRGRPGRGRWSSGPTADAPRPGRRRPAWRTWPPCAGVVPRRAGSPPPGRGRPGRRRRPRWDRTCSSTAGTSRAPAQPWARKIPSAVRAPAARRAGAAAMTLDARVATAAAPGDRARRRRRQHQGGGGGRTTSATRIVSEPFELWREPEGLAEAIASVVGRLGLDARSGRADDDRRAGRRVRQQARGGAVACSTAAERALPGRRLRVMTTAGELVGLDAGAGRAAGVRGRQLGGDGAARRALAARRDPARLRGHDHRRDPDRRRRGRRPGPHRRRAAAGRRARLHRRAADEHRGGRLARCRSAASPAR